MFCVYCGKEIEDGSRFCPYCGASVQIEQENTAHGGSAVSNDLEKDKYLKKEKLEVVIVLAVTALILIYEMF